jgi:hypothetical protein
MSEDAASVNVPVSALAALAVEYWRIGTWINAANAAGAGPARHAIRKMGDFLKSVEVDVEGMEGKTFDAGMACVVVDSVEDEAMEAGKVVIEETVSPMVMWKGKVVRNAQVVTRKGKKS